MMGYQSTNILRRSARYIGARRSGKRFYAAWLLALGLAITPMLAQAQNPEPPPPLPTGVVKLPDTAPPTGQQTPLPNPALRIPKPDKPLYRSPGLAALSEALRNRPITINDAVAIALAVNRDLATAGSALLRAQGRTDETRAAFNPTLGSTLSFTQLSQAQNATINGVSVPLVNDQQRQIGVQATLPLDISGLLRAATDQAKFQEVAARLDINRTRNQIVVNVKNAFYGVLRAQALVVVNQESLQNSLTNLDDAQKKLQDGTVARFDVIRAQTAVANAQQQLISARNQVSLAFANLNNAIGVDIDTPLQVASEGAVETPPEAANLTYNPVPPSSPPPAEAQPAQDNLTQTAVVVTNPLTLGPEYDTVLREALQTRPEILQADATIAAAKKGILLAQRSQLPSLNLSWGLTYAPDAAGFSPIETQWQAVASISLPIFDGGVARARVRQSRADVATAETSKRTSIDTVTLDVRQAYLNLIQARNQVIVANQGLIEARESYRLARVRYNAGVSAQAGVSPLLELSDAQNALTQAQSTQVNALYDYNNARAQLDRAIGRYSFVNNGPGYAAPPPPKATGSPDRGGKK